MMQRPNPRRGKRPGSRMSQPFELTRQQSAEQGLAETAEAVLPTEEAPTPAQSLPAYRACAAAAQQSLAPGEALGWGQPGWPVQTAVPLGGTQNLLLLNLTFTADTDGLAAWSLRLGDHLAAVLSAQVQAGQSVTTMLNIHLPAEQDAAVTLWNDSEMPLVVQQGSLDLLTLEE